MKRILQWVSVPVLLLLLTACNNQETITKNEPTTPVIKAVNVATEVPYAPFEYEEDGELKGFDMDVMRAVGKAVGWDVTIQKENFDDVFQKVDDGTYDIGIAAITASEERKEQHDFSRPYFTTYQLILVHQEFKVASLKELKGKSIAVQKNTTGHDFVLQELGEKGDALLAYDDMDQVIASFVSGEADAMVGDNAVILDYLKHSNFTDYALIKDENAPLEYFGIMTKKGNHALLQELNRGIDLIQENGVYDEIYERYFGT